jgi:hypothetical protein
MTSNGADVADRSEPAPPSPARVPSFVTRTAPIAGPLLIVLSVLIMTRGFWLGGRLSSEHPDLLSFWLPRWCAMGTAVAHGHVPTWLPNQFGGVPFASDPQSGWIYVPVLLLFGVASCARALGLVITLNPILAGLGMYLFFRKEGTGRPAATVGGLVMAMSIAGSFVILSMPFSGTLAWTGMTLGATSGMLHATKPSRIVAWLAFVGFSWSQIAAAHLTDGLLIGTLLVGAYAVARLCAQARVRDRSWRSVAAMLVLLAVALPLLSAAVLVPRLALLPRTSIGQGYVHLGALTRAYGGFTGKTALALSPITFAGTGPWWLTAFARGPGAYVGAVSILLLPIGFALRRWRLPAIGFAVCGLIGWLLNQNVLIHSRIGHHAALSGGLGELWMRDPYRFRYLLLPAFAALAGYGFQGWLDLAARTDRRGERARWALVGGAALLFVVLPLVAGAPLRLYIPFVLGAIVTLPLVWLAARGRGWAAAALAGVLFLELTATGLAGQHSAAEVAVPGGSGLGRAFPTWHSPRIKPAAYLTPGAIGRRLIAARGDGGRYLSFDPQLATSDPRGFLLHQGADTWPAYANGRATLFGLADIQGYSPVQLMPYWSYLRTVNTAAPIYYNSATFQKDGRNILDLFGVEWVVQPTALAQKPPGGTAVATEGHWTLYRIAGAAPRAAFVPAWSVVTEDQARVLTARSDFDSTSRVLLEQTPTVGGRALPTSTPSSEIAGITPTNVVRYRESAPGHAVVNVSTNTPGIVVIRTPWDENWHATLNGHPVPLLHADYVMQGVAVPAGRWAIALTYRDPAIGDGMWVSAVAWLLLLIAFLGLLRRDGSRSRQAAGDGTS